jgi:hypothetical protein
MIALTILSGLGLLAIVAVVYRATVSMDRDDAELIRNARK